MQNEKQLQSIFNTAAFTKLSKIKNLSINKTYDTLGCLYSQNQYNIYSSEFANENEQSPIFQCSEMSSCCQRDFCCGSCREYKLVFRDCHQLEGNNTPSPNETMIEFVKPFKFTLCGLNRPVLEVNLVQNEETVHLGKLVIPFACCCSAITIDVLDNNETKKFTLSKAFCSSIIMHGACFCSKDCQEGDIQIFDQNEGESLLSVKYPRCFITQTNYELQFPPHYQVKDKILLLAAIFMFDMCIIEEDMRRRGPGLC